MSIAKRLSNFLLEFVEIRGIWQFKKVSCNLQFKPKSDFHQISNTFLLDKFRGCLKIAVQALTISRPFLFRFLTGTRLEPWSSSSSTASTPSAAQLLRPCQQLPSAAPPTDTLGKQLSLSPQSRSTRLTCLAQPRRVSRKAYTSYFILPVGYIFDCIRISPQDFGYIENTV